MFWSHYILSSEEKGNQNVNGGGYCHQDFNDGHFVGEVTREKLVVLDKRTWLRSKWHDLNYTSASEFVSHLEMQICTPH